MILNRHDGIRLIPILLLTASLAVAQDNAPEADATDPETGTSPTAEEGLEQSGLTDVDATNPEGVTVPVAEDDLAADIEVAASPLTEEEMLRTEFQRFKELMEDGALDEADSSAKRIIELAISTSGPRSTEMAKALTNLAVVQYQSGNYEAAQQNYEAAVEIIEEVEDRLNEGLVNPLQGLAAAQLQSGRPDLAAKSYRRAVHVTHVNEGPHNLRQVELLENLAEVRLRMGDSATARELQETIFALNARHYDANSLEMVPALMRRAKWQHRAGFIYDERATYRRVIRIIEGQLGSNAIALVDPLILLGRSFFAVDTSGTVSHLPRSASSGEIYFKRALRVAAESPDSNWSIIADATLALGDFYMQNGETQSARATYVKAWNLLSERDPSGAKLEKRRAELEGIVLLQGDPLPEYVGDAAPTGVQDADDPIRRGTVTMSYSISERGRVANLKLVENQPPEFLDVQRTVQREMRRRVFRPRFVDGESVATENQLLVHSYYYRQSDLDALRETSEAEVEGDPT